MLLTERDSVEIKDIEEVVYQSVNEDRRWRVELVEILLQAREKDGMEDSDLELLEWLCID